ncbi:MAG TPA: FAD-binding oxidoreductase [Thermoplasmataceae archaeon]|nr:FAD-binding oxidoreductase [Thermoplasmataceae archaeon]
MEDAGGVYDVAVIGAGITGLTSAYYIKKNDQSLRVIVIDRARSFAQGNTGRATAGFRDLFSSGINFNLSNSSISFYRSIQDGSNYDMGMKFVGYMFLLNEDDSRLDVLDEVRRKTKVRVLGRDELEGIRGLSLEMPGEESSLLGIKPAVSAYIGENCGIFEPDLVAGFYFDELRKMGVEFLFNTDVKKLILTPREPLDYPGEPFLWQDKKIGGLDISRGEIRADFYVIATDVWTDFLLGPVGIDSHMRPRKRQVFQIGGPHVEAMLTEFSINNTGIFPFTVLPYYGVHFRPAPKEKQMRVSAPDYIGRDFSLEEYPEAEKSYYEYSIKPVLQSYFPSLGDASIKGMWAGYYSYNTLDAHPFIFRDMNIIVATGTSGSGLMKGDAIGRIVASTYSGKERTELFNGHEIENSNLGVVKREVPRERFVL